MDAVLLSPTSTYGNYTYGLVWVNFYNVTNAMKELTTSKEKKVVEKFFPEKARSEKVFTL